MRISILAPFSYVLAVAITLAGCGGDGSQSQQGLSPNLVGSAKQPATTSAVEFKWFSATTDIPPGQIGAAKVMCSAPFTHVVAGGYTQRYAGPFVIGEERPIFGPDGWSAGGRNSDTGAAAHVTAWVDCTNAPVGH